MTEREEAPQLLEQVDLLSGEECVALREEIFTLREVWLQRHEELPFYTLGVASYLDATDGRFAEYQERARDLNRSLNESFAWLYQRIADTLARRYDVPCVYEEGLARPGFHIFLSHQEFDSPGKRHYDLQFQHIDWSAFGEPQTGRQLSFTLAVKLPRGGGGIDVWNINGLVFGFLSPEGKKRLLAENREPTRFSYSAGGMAIHAGHHLHQIAPMPNMLADDERITLQGHAVPVGDRWILYWWRGAGTGQGYRVKSSISS